MRLPIISDTTRTVRAESQVVEFDGIEHTIWNVVTRCPVNGISVLAEYFITREEADAHIAEVLS